jgi:hypothetical protein
MILKKLFRRVRSQSYGWCVSYKANIRGRWLKRNQLVQNRPVSRTELSMAISKDPEFEFIREVRHIRVIQYLPYGQKLG